MTSTSQIPRRRRSWVPRSLRQAIIRRRANVDSIPVERYCIRIARTEREYEQAFRLLHVAYVYEGIECLKALELRMSEQHVLPEATVLVAYEGEQLVGTLTLTLDSPAGLPLDHDYPSELEALRAQGAKIAEMGSLAVVRRCRKTGLFVHLGHAAARVAFRLMGTTHIVMGVHPRAEDVYRSVWAFEPLGAPRPHADLNAPVLALALERESARSHGYRHYTKPLSNGRLPGDYVFGELPLTGFDIPENISENDWGRWKMPRDVFQRLFIDRTNRLTTLSAKTQRYLRQKRSDETLELQRK